PDRAPDAWINEGRCARWSALARPEAAGGEIAISLFETEPLALPLTVSLLERHPLGTQAFLPLEEVPWLVVVAADAGGVPGAVRAFRVPPRAGVQIGRGVWHAPLIALAGPARFAVVDRIGPGANLEEHRLPRPLRIIA
ncbi:MAG: Ureidoglycolate hydrolase, partial [Alphaproteobacteria bacterium]